MPVMSLCCQCSLASPFHFNLLRPVFSSVNACRKTLLEIYFIYLGNMENCCILRQCLITSVLFSTKCCLLHNFFFLYSNNVLVYHKPCTKNLDTHPSRIKFNKTPQQWLLCHTVGKNDHSKHANFEAYMMLVSFTLQFMKWYVTMICRKNYVTVTRVIRGYFKKFPHFIF